MTTLTGDQRAVMKEIAFEAAEKTVDRFSAELKDEIIPHVVKETLSGLGQDVTNPQEVQADYHFLRKTRKKSEKWEELKMGMWMRVLGGVVTFAAVAYFSYTLGIKS